MFLPRPETTEVSKWEKVISKIDVCPFKRGKLDALGGNSICKEDLLERCRDTGQFMDI